MATENEYTSSEGAPDQSELIAALKKFIRTQGEGYLRDPNVSSIGIARKTTDSRPEGEIALQFTVDKKAQPEQLEALGTKKLPESITVDGVEVPTEVLQRSYEPQFRVVAEAESPTRHKRLDPALPGVSVGHVNVSAGTIGCVVFDRHDGTPYVLSNWHVLHGASGEPGEDVVQPGQADDPHIDRNRLGRLERSHLGFSGDCAVATVEDRRFDADILDLGVAPEELGEPEIGDTVVKSGRTTGVTHGVVRSPFKLVQIDYRGVGPRNVLCFEIGVDPNIPPENGEISLPGDSGSVWMFKDPGGRPGKVLAGLHFAGESRADPDEHALACLPQLVFEELGITLRPPVPEAVEVLEGYNPNFLRARVPAPRLDPRIEHDLFRLGDADDIPYTHFSLALSKSRRFALWVAWNIDGGALKRLDRRGIPFSRDPRIPDEAQVGDELYRANRVDRGHLARRADLLWGSLAEARKANTDSFFFTNIAPQMDDFNQSSRGGLWGRLEDAVFEGVKVDDLRVSVFAGPVFQSDDRLYRGVRLPREYWKVLVFSDQGELRTTAFLLTQNLDQLEALELDEFRVFQVTLSEVEERCRLRFPDPLHEAETLAVPEALAQRAPLESLSEIRWS
ncbi:DNA/RNA non-specific endonuclease [Nocardiopsis sp. EMB25]|uniref:DNA/RNA non-specific endonuclease n=1 Tax=Nocardiopsis sp. EMB25 TaxID=2835867 RepID=UPI00228413C6|nr:DNA/RNA non-specific endonuclease [Nocardiopsis sp. EMB25]MCY9784362.1 DNA/RNA non-specific endonuclease [Nocardiopsis sp. EMB25]